MHAIFCSRSGWMARFFFLAGAIAISGCRETPTSVSGSVTLDGEPLKIASDMRGTVLFQAVGGQGAVATGILDPAGHYQLAVGSSTEIPPGKYQVAITASQLLPKSEKGEQQGKLITPLKYMSAQSSGLQAEVKPGENQFDFALSTADADNATFMKAHE